MAVWKRLTVTLAAVMLMMTAEVKLEAAHRRVKAGRAVVFFAHSSHLANQHVSEANTNYPIPEITISRFYGLPNSQDVHGCSVHREETHLPRII